MSSPASFSRESLISFRAPCQALIVGRYPLEKPNGSPQTVISPAIQRELLLRGGATEADEGVK